MLVTGFPDDDDNLFGGRYRIISRLGAGAYRAWDEQEGRLVVIKIVKKAFLDDPKFTEGFARKIRLLQGLRHPHIVPIVDVDVGEHDGLPFVVIVMRFLPGGSLSNRRLRDDNGKVLPNPPGMLHLWLPDVADALDHVHANGVVHRDVKPANIFFDAYWNAFLGDFGNAKIVEESDSFDRENTLTATNMGIGTQEYMGPEQFSPKPVLDGRTDQYALAVMVYEMVSGTRPFTGATAHIVVEVTSMPAPRLDGKVRGLPCSLVHAVHRGLTKSPDERFSTCREFAAAVLRDVKPLADDPGIARLLCPRCSNLLKLPVAAAGQCGLCPKCQTQMKVADDLSWLITADEAKRAMIPFPDRSEVEPCEPFEPFDYDPIIFDGNWAGSPRSGLGRVAITAFLIGTAFLLLASQFFLWRVSRHGPLGNEESLNNRRDVFGSVEPSQLNSETTSSRPPADP
jgi:serine/threonine protein kinase